MMNNLYVQDEEVIDKFDITFSYDLKELNKILEKLGINSKEIVSVGMNGFIRKSDVPAFNKMFDNFKDEYIKTIEHEKYAYELFNYEMMNHEYIITFKDEEILSDCDVDKHLFIADERLKEIYIKAKMEQSFNQICDNIKTFLENEHHIQISSNELFDKELRCSLLYTFKGEEDEFEYQVYLDLKGNQIIKKTTYSDFIIHYDYETYDNWSDLAEITKDLDFDDLYSSNESISDLETIINIIS